MGTPNEFMPSALYGFQQDGVASYAHQTNQPNANFSQFANSETSYYNNSEFSPAAFNRNTLPTFPEHSVRPTDFNAAPFVPEKPQPSTSMNVYDAKAASNNMYWSQQSLFSPFGVLPHELAAEHPVDPATMYENSRNAHFVNPHTSLNTTPNDFCEKSRAIASGKSAELLNQYGHEPMAEVQQNSPVAYNSARLAYGNGVINHSGPQGRSVSADNVEPGCDYRAYKSELVFPSSSATVMKPVKTRFTMSDVTSSQINTRLHTNSPLIQPKLTESLDPNRPTTYMQQNMSEFHDSNQSSPVMHQNLNEYHDNNQSSPVMHQNLNEYHDNNQSSPLIHQNIADYHDGSRSSPHTIVPNHTAQSSHCESSFLTRNLVNTVPRADLPLVYRDTSNVACGNADENRVTSPYLKLPYSTSTTVISPSANATEIGHANQSLYAVYSNLTNDSAANLPPKELTAETLSSCRVQERTNFPELTTASSPVTYPSVIMRTDQNYENCEKSGSGVLWGSADSIDSPAVHRFNESNTTTSYPMSTQQPHTSALNEQRDSYFCGPEVVENDAAESSDTKVFDSVEEHQMPEQHVQHHQCGGPISSALPVEEPVPKPNSRKRRTSTTSAPAAKSSSKNIESGIPLGSPNTVSEPQGTHQPASTSHDEGASPKVLRAHSPQASTSSAADTSLDSTVSKSDVSHPHSSSDATSPPPPRTSTSPPSSQSAQSHDPLVSPTESDPGTQSSSAADPVPSAARPKSIWTSKKKRNVQVIVLDIEEEFKFLFDPELPHYNEIASDEGLGGACSKPSFHRNNVDFLATYKKFLDNNCENVEKLSCRGRPKRRTSAQEKSKSMTEVENADLENDSRKLSDEQRHTDISSNDDVDGRSEHRKKSKTDAVLQKPVQSTTESMTMKTKHMNEMDSRSSKEKVKLKKQGRHKDRKSKLKGRKNSKEGEECELSADEMSEDLAKKTDESFDRKTTLRKPKIEVQEKIKKAVEMDDYESADSDPSWSPGNDDEPESASTRKSTRVRTVRQTKKLPEPNSSARKDAENGTGKEDDRELFDGETNNGNVGSFYIQKNHIGSRKYPLWRLENDRLQKFEHRKKDGKLMFSSVSQYVKISNSRLSEYDKIEVRVVHQSKNHLTVELCDETDIPTDAKIRDSFMRDSLRYENQFAIYVQTLVSQALDSNFLTEIVRQNDTYFLDNIKVIEDVMATYLNDLSSVMKCGSTTVDLLMRTWPFVSIDDSYRSGEDVCTCCCEMNASKTAIFYGQPYKRETLQGCTSNIPNDIDKTADICKGCATKIQLFNKIWHQKYHLFVECAKCVSKKKTLHKNKVTTDILSELLADNLWLSKLFHNIRNTWLMIWTVVQKTRKKLH